METENIRIKYLDILRGIAVVLMVQQHLIGWLWKENWFSYELSFVDHPVMLTLNFLGNFSAPLFILLAGIGAQFSRRKAESIGFFYFKRGLFLIVCGYILNILSPHWFKPWSWYVLHVIGLSLICMPLFKRMNTFLITAFFFFSILASALLQTFFATPLMIGNDFMNSCSRAGGVLRLIFAEGHFSVFPWIGLFAAGIICGRWITAGDQKKIIYAGLFCIVTGLLLGFLHSEGYYFATGGLLYRLFIFLPYFYPPLPAFMYSAAGTVFVSIFLFSKIEEFVHGFIPRSIISVGNTSLSWFFIHIVLVNEIGRYLGIGKSLNTAATLIVILIFIITIMIISPLWKKVQYKYGLEWVMRRCE